MAIGEILIGIFSIIGTAILVYALAKTIGWVIRRFSMTKIHLGILWVLGFVLMGIGFGTEGSTSTVSTVIGVCGIIILTFASGGFAYFYFIKGEW